MPCPLPFTENGASCVLVLPEEIVDKHGHRLDGDADPKAKNGCDHRDTPEWKAEHRKHWATRAESKEKHMDEIKPPEVVPPAPVVTTASVGVLLDVPPNIMALIPKDGSASIVTVLLALVVTAGAVAWKFGPGWMDAKREREAKQAELEEKRIDQQSSQHIECKVAREHVEARVASIESTATGLSARVDELAGKVEQHGSISVSGNDLVKKVSKLEKALKALTKAPSALKKGKS